MYWCLPAALYLLSTFSAACFEISDVWVSTHFDHFKLEKSRSAL